MKHYLTSAATAVALSVTLSTPASAGGVLNTAVNDWTGGAVMCEIVHQILENELDYKVKRIVMPSGAGRDEAIRSGDLDYGCELWPSYSTSNTEHLEENGGDGSIIKFGDSGVVGVSSYYVPVS